MLLWCRIFHRRFVEELLVHEPIWDGDGHGWTWTWTRFKHCNKCHEPLLDPAQEYRTPAEHETKVREKMLQGSLE